MEHTNIVIGEVIETNTTDFVAQSRDVFDPPELGSLVKIQLPSSGDHDPFAELPPAVYGVVCQVSTIRTDVNRQPDAYWKDEKLLKEEHPELEDHLKTSFRAIVIGHSLDRRFVCCLPPTPPRLHFSQVQRCNASDVREITTDMGFLRMILNFADVPADEVVAACVRFAYQALGSDDSVRLGAGKELAGLLRDDYDRLHAIVRRFPL